MRIPTILFSNKGWVMLAVLVAGLTYALADLPLPGVGILLASVPCIYFVMWSIQSRTFIDWSLHEAFDQCERWPVHVKVFPLYKFVDLYHAAQTFVEGQPNTRTLRSQHDEPLARILARDFHSEESRKRKAPVMIPRKVDYDQETFVPSDTFWLLQAAPDATVGPAIIRIRFNDYTNEVHLEIAAERSDGVGAIMDTLINLASTNSIYRNRVIAVAFEPAVRDTYGDVESAERFDLLFHKPPHIRDSDIILDPRIQVLLERTIVDFHNRRTELMQLGLPGKRGVLLYGPPGMGKTYTCKYLAQRLVSATTIVATGHALAHIKSVCNVAKLLQPALVLLEDVDLVFTDRQINPYSTVLGEFMDELDGFGEGDQVIFVLTTNAIERVEAAIKDRPGRISQCIYFGPPHAELRTRYLHTLLQPYASASVNMPQLVARTEGVSQAFLKELVFRAVQIATETLPAKSASVCLTDQHLDTALTEMTAGGRASKRIIGFHVEA